MHILSRIFLVQARMPTCLPFDVDEIIRALISAAGVKWIYTFDTNMENENILFTCKTPMFKAMQPFRTSCPGARDGFSEEPRFFQ